MLVSGVRHLGLVPPGHQLLELGEGDEAIMVMVEGIEGIPDAVLGVSGCGAAQLADHELEELGPLNSPAAVAVDVRQEGGQLLLQGSAVYNHHCCLPCLLRRSMWGRTEHEN